MWGNLFVFACDVLLKVVFDLIHNNFFLCVCVVFKPQCQCYRSFKNKWLETINN